MPAPARGEIPIFTFAHLSDLHATPVVPGALGPLASKRILGWLSWKLRRGAIHQPEVLEALLADLQRSEAEQIVITGDLTNISLPSEFASARRWLERIGTPERVTLVPGNHDAYVEVPSESGWDLWADYLSGDTTGPADSPPERAPAFPTLRTREPLAIVGLSSALPTAPLLASGEIGAKQLAQLEEILADASIADRFRVVLLHHPPEPGVVSRRRGLRDGGALAEVLRRVGAELVLHGHLHRTRVASLAGPHGPIPVVGVRSASERGSKPGKRAQYHLYDVEPSGRANGRTRYRVGLRARGLDPGTGEFVADGSRELVAGA